MKKDGVLRILIHLKEEVKQKYKAKIRGVFGSYVNKKLRQHSDIDILVDFSEKADLLDLVGLSLFLEQKLNRKIDIVPYSLLRKEIKEGVLKEAVYI